MATIKANGRGVGVAERWRGWEKDNREQCEQEIATVPWYEQRCSGWASFHRHVNAPELDISALKEFIKYDPVIDRGDSEYGVVTGQKGIIVRLKPNVSKERSIDAITFIGTLEEAWLSSENSWNAVQTCET